MNNILYGCTRMYNGIHQSDVLVNMRFSLINTFAGMQCSATLKGRSFAQTLTRWLGLGSRLCSQAAYHWLLEGAMASNECLFVVPPLQHVQKQEN